VRAPLPIDAPDEVREEERFDAERLRPFLAAALPGTSGPMEVLQFRKGHSNLTYLVRIGDSEAVLRRAPFGVQVKSAHDMRREFTILSALQGVYAKAPRPIAFCDDESLIGARFYLMERVRGVVVRGAEPPPGVTFTPELLQATSTALVDNLADLHAVDFARAGLGRRSRLPRRGSRATFPRRAAPRSSTTTTSTTTWCSIRPTCPASSRSSTGRWPPWAIR
jgi:aminoglycoside phosphotransferase (APT) family kinase protein